MHLAGEPRENQCPAVRRELRHSREGLAHRQSAFQECREDAEPKREICRRQSGAATSMTWRFPKGECPQAPRLECTIGGLATLCGQHPGFQRAVLTRRAEGESMRRDHGWTGPPHEVISASSSVPPVLPSRPSVYKS